MFRKEDSVPTEILLKEESHYQEEHVAADVVPEEKTNEEEGLETLLVQTVVEASKKKRKSVFRSIRNSTPSSRLVLSACVLDAPIEEQTSERDEVHVVSEKDATREAKKETERDLKEKPKVSVDEDSTAVTKPKGIWRCYLDPTTNTPYYFNRVTRKTTWHRPSDVDIKDLTGVKTTAAAEEVVEEEKAKAGQVKSKSKTKRGLSFALRRKRTEKEEESLKMEEDEDTEAESLDEQDEEEEGEEGHDDVEIDIAGSAIAWDGAVLCVAPIYDEEKDSGLSFKRKKKKLSMKRSMSLFKSRKVGALDVSPEGREEHCS